jgi:phage terminase large subunit-like protein
MAARNSNGLTPARQTIWERWGNRPVEFIRDCIRDPKTFKYARDPKTNQLVRDHKGRLIKVYQPFKLFPQQERFIREAFTLTPEGHFPYADMIYSTPKKNGKSSTAAMLALYTAIVIGDRQPYSSVYVISNDLEQSTSVVFELIKRMIEANPGLRNLAKVTSTRIDFPGTGAFIVAVAHDVQTVDMECAR